MSNDSDDESKKQVLVPDQIKLPSKTKKLFLILDKLRCMGLSARYDLFAQKPIIKGLGPTFDGPLSDAALGEIWRRLLESGLNGVLSQKPLSDLILTEAHRHQFHPVREYLYRLQWDNKPRLDTWMTDYLGAEDTQLNRDIGRLFLIAAVRRVREPGCKFDNIPVFGAKQGAGKSSMLRVLAVNPDWFSDSFPSTEDSQKQIEALTGKWILEYPELAGLGARDQEHVKAFLSRQCDRARPAYGRFQMELPRQCVMAGTTNYGEYLVDLTGNRRYWPVGVADEIRLQELERDVSQLWAEASAAEATLESIFLRKELWKDAEVKQIECTKLIPYEAEIHDLLGKYEEGAFPMVDDIRLALGISTTAWGREQQAVGKAIKKAGWVTKKLGKDEHGTIRGKWVYYKIKDSLFQHLPTITLPIKDITK